jgi:hypothetical protein
VVQDGNIYSLYGLRVRSAIPLPCPEWRGSENVADVHLVEATEEQLRNSCNAPLSRFESDGFWECRLFEDGAIHASWKGHFDFFVSSDGTRVLWRRLVGVPDEVLFTYLLNQVLSECLVARGAEPLHATSVVIGGEAIAILGDSGHGKSTLAAALMGMGHRLLTDDVLVLEFVDSGVLAYPSLARLKLHPDTADAVFAGRRSLPMNTFTDKMILPLGGAEHAARPVPLRAMYAIPSAAGAARISIRSAGGRRSMLELVKGAFSATLLSPARLEQQFNFASRLAKSVPIKLLSYPRRLDLLPQVAAAVVADLSKEAVTS